MSKILIIEDNRDLAFGLANNLEIEGYSVRMEEDGRRGLEAMVDWSPDLVILDLMLPEMDGFRVLRSMREQSLHTPVLILSARGEEVDKVRGFRLGADDYVTKPFGILELLARIEALLRRTSATGPDSEEVWESFGIRGCQDRSENADGLEGWQRGFLDSERIRALGGTHPAQRCCRLPQCAAARGLGACGSDSHPDRRHAHRSVATQT